MVFNKSLRNPLDKSFVINCDSKEKKLIEYADLISPANLNEKDVTNSLGFFSSTKAPKKKFLNSSNQKKTDENLKNKRKRLEKYFSTVDLESWSDRNFILPNRGSEHWHDDLHYIVLKQQEKSNLFHQLWLFLMLILFCLLLIAIAGLVYSKNSVLRNHQDESNSYEFMQKFIDDFNHTDHKNTPDEANRYLIKQQDESTENWLQREAKYLSSILGARENEPLNLTKKEEDNNQAKRSAELIEDVHFKSLFESKSNDKDDLMADESSIAEKIEDNLKESFRNLARDSKSGLKSLFSKFKDMF